MLALILRSAGWSPSFVIGGEVNEVGSNAAFGEGEWLVVEADESDGTFLHLSPQAALVTNIEPDHLDYYGDFDALVRAFEQFVASVDRSGGVRAPTTRSPRASRTTVRHCAPTASPTTRDYRILDEVVDAASCRFTLAAPDGAQHRRSRSRPESRRPPTPPARSRSRGSSGSTSTRRCAHWRPSAASPAASSTAVSANGVTFIDDYAHLPTEVGAAIEAARQGPWRRVVVVFQPHRYSRTASIGPQFADAFTAADALVLTDVYPAGETPIPGVSGRVILRAVLDRHPALPVAYLPRRADLAPVPTRYARPGDLVLRWAPAISRRCPTCGSARPYESHRAARRRTGGRARARLPGAVQTNAPSAPLTTYRCGGPLAVLVRLDREADLVAAGAPRSRPGPRYRSS